MAAKREGHKNYKAGDPIHIVVTQDFVDDANDFFSYCRERGYNPSQVIRQAMKEWLLNQRNSSVEAHRSESDQSGSFDEKLVELIRERKGSSRKMSLKTVKEILEEED